MIVRTRRGQTVSLDTDRLDQHLTIDKSLIKEMLYLANVCHTDTVLDIGAGLGILTQALAEKAKKVLAVEVDPRFVEILRGLGERYSNIEVIYGNILSVCLPPFDKIVSCIPYSISEPLLEKLIHTDFDLAVLVVGRKLAYTMTTGIQQAKTRLSLLIPAYFDTRLERIVNCDAFLPKPRVKSALIQMTPKSKAGLTNSPLVYVLREIFDQRDKKLKNALRESLIRSSIACKNKPMTKREARNTIHAMCLSEQVLNKQTAAVSCQDLLTVIGKIKTSGVW